MKDELSAEAVISGLSTRVIGRRVLYYPSVDSTNDAARAEAEHGAVEGTVEVAAEQTVGKGRLKRAWLSPPGSVALSIVLRPPVAHLPHLIMVASLAVVSAIEQTTHLKAAIKWPNDVLVGEKKICGILIENRLRGNAVDFAVIGIGINVNLRMSDYPGVASTATSLSEESGREISRRSVVVALLESMDRLYASLPGQVYEMWRDRLVTLGRRITVTWGGMRHEGIADSVARDGSLLLRGDDGAVTKIVAGDASLRA